MIFDALFTIIFAPIGWLVGLLPAFTAPSGEAVSEAGVAFGATLNVLNSFVNVPLAMLLVGISLAGAAVSLTARVATWFYRLVPGKAT